MKRKTIIVFLLIVILCSAFVACGEKKANEANNTSESTSADSAQGGILLPFDDEEIQSGDSNSNSSDSKVENNEVETGALVDFESRSTTTFSINDETKVYVVESNGTTKIIVKKAPTSEPTTTTTKKGEKPKANSSTTTTTRPYKLPLDD